ncbi:VTT domain-containing protein [Roseomonas marmotae]|uniref:Phospholipase D n=1 Tax=Roseomonas marmotae TaxID=2768161 RepID=A0ABS3KG08_9PROT|nr:VTT domain-containing protein [Roseomonas marmotae]MBO1075276.1 VTT domain-containing protein [Roseomonas marmotae]QTI78258.1 VTT domain-containing protein [Roseomonas marmotae]
MQHILAPVASRQPDDRLPSAGSALPGVLKEGKNVWRLEQAGRAGVLVDAATYYGALREALLKAEKSVLIAGWDIDSRTPLFGAGGKPKDELPSTLGPFLAALVARRPDLRIKLLLWDYSVLYALERELLPALALHWNTPSQIELCLDDEVPLGASHHQKIVVVDDRLAFSGGLDLTIRRWDTPAHAPHNPHRIDPREVPYAPFHDVQMVVDGEAAGALADLFRARWARSACEELPARQPPRPGARDLWPRAVNPDLRDLQVGIARTQAAYEGEPEIREVEHLFEAMIDAAEDCIYAENQFYTNLRLAARLAERMLLTPRLEVVLLGPRTHHTWLEHRTMLAGRIRFMALLREAGVADRIRMLYPHVGERHSPQADVMVHSKVMIVDDRLLRVGSANLCNRSMATDTECDLVVEGHDEQTRGGIRQIRDRMLAEHLGVRPEQVAALTRGGSLFRALDHLHSRKRRLLPIEDGELAEGEGVPQIEAVADPRRPFGPGTVLADFETEDAASSSGMALWLRIGLVVAPMVILSAAWRYTPLSDLMNPTTFSSSMEAGGHWGPLLALGLFMLLGLLAFPVNVLIVATAAAFGLWPGLLYAAAGAMISAVLTYLVGRRMGPGLLRKLIGPRINKVSRSIAVNGILAVTMVRLMPIAPFTLVNLVAGAIRIPLLDYVVGTALGLAPGLLLMTALGDRLLRIVTDPSLTDVLGFVVVLICWGALTWGLQSLIKRLRRMMDRKRDAAA